MSDDGASIETSPEQLKDPKKAVSQVGKGFLIGLGGVLQKMGDVALEGVTPDIPAKPFILGLGEGMAGALGSGYIKNKQASSVLAGFGAGGFTKMAGAVIDYAKAKIGGITKPKVPTGGGTPPAGDDYEGF